MPTSGHWRVQWWTIQHASRPSQVMPSIVSSRQATSWYWRNSQPLRCAGTWRSRSLPSNKHVIITKWQLFHALPPKMRTCNPGQIESLSCCSLHVSLPTLRSWYRMTVHLILTLRCLSTQSPLRLQWQEVVIQLRVVLLNRCRRPRSDCQILIERTISCCY